MSEMIPFSKCYKKKCYSWAEIGSRWQSRRTCTQLLWASKSQLPVEQPSTGGCWNPPKKDTWHLKTKQKPQWDVRRGAIMVKSNLLPDRWMTHKQKNNNTKEVLPLLWKLWAPWPGDLVKRQWIPQESYLEGQRWLITGLPTGLG